MSNTVPHDNNGDVNALPDKRQRTPYREWIPVKERLPAEAGSYATLVKPLLEDESYEQIQRYKPMAHRAISGWTYASTTHWRPL